MIARFLGGFTAHQKICMHTEISGDRKNSEKKKRFISGESVIFDDNFETFSALFPI